MRDLVGGASWNWERVSQLDQIVARQISGLKNWFFYEKIPLFSTDTKNVCWCFRDCKIHKLWKSYKRFFNLEIIQLKWSHMEDATEELLFHENVLFSLNISYNFNYFLNQINYYTIKQICSRTFFLLITSNKYFFLIFSIILIIFRIWISDSVSSRANHLRFLTSWNFELFDWLWSEWALNLSTNNPCWFFISWNLES